MRKSSVLIALAAVIILAGAAFAMTRGGEDDKPTNTATPPPVTTTTEPPAPEVMNTEDPFNNSTTEITYSDNGFGSQSSSVKQGGSLTIKNTSSRKLDFASDPHPAHTEHPQLNIGTIDPGESTTISVTKVGTWGFHNHLRPGDTGKIIVE